MYFSIPCAPAVAVATSMVPHGAECSKNDGDRTQSKLDVVISHDFIPCAPVVAVATSMVQQEATYSERDRTHIQPKHMTFGDTLVRVIDAVPGATRKPFRVHDPFYQHTAALRLKNKNPFVCEMRAKLQACALREDVRLDYLLLNGGCEPQHNQMTRTWSRAYDSAVAHIDSRRWLVDTGCPIDLISRDSLHVDELSFVKQAGRGIKLNTANGVTYAEDIVAFQIDGLEDLIEAYILESTPIVMSLGKRCMDYGYSFEWKSKIATLTTPGGKRIVLDITNDVPYMPRGSVTACGQLSLIMLNMMLFQVPSLKNLMTATVLTNLRVLRKI